MYTGVNSDPLGLCPPCREKNVKNNKNTPIHGGVFVGYPVNDQASIFFTDSFFNQEVKQFLQSWRTRRSA